MQTSHPHRRSKVHYSQLQGNYPPENEQQVQEYVAPGHDPRFVEPTPGFKPNVLVAEQSPVAHPTEKNHRYSTELTWREQDCCTKIFYFCLLLWCCCCYQNDESVRCLFLFEKNSLFPNLPHKKNAANTEKNV